MVAKMLFQKVLFLELLLHLTKVRQNQLVTNTGLRTVLDPPTYILRSQKVKMNKENRTIGILNSFATDSIKINQPGYVLAEFLTAYRSCKTNYFWKNSYRSFYSRSLRFFWHLLRSNWSIVRGTVRSKTFG